MASLTLAMGERSHSLGEATWVGSVTNAVLFPVNNDGVGYPRAEGAQHDSWPCRRTSRAGDRNGEVNQFHSRHAGGVNFLFADGHVSFLKTTMAYKTFPSPGDSSRGRGHFGRLLR